MSENQQRVGVDRIQVLGSSWRRQDDDQGILILDQIQNFICGKSKGELFWTNRYRENDFIEGKDVIILQILYIYWQQTTSFFNSGYRKVGVPNSRIQPNDGENRVYRGISSAMGETHTMINRQPYAEGMESYMKTCLPCRHQEILVDDAFSQYKMSI